MIIYLIGKPGSGKGTVAQELVKEGYIHLSTGDLLRQEILSGSKVGKEIDNLLKDGKFATDEHIFPLVKKFLNENEGKNIILDGFPRNLAQYNKLKEFNIEIDFTFLLNISNNIIKDRIVNRRVHIPSGRIYNILTNPPKNENKDDVTGEELTHRNDDKLEIIEGRIEKFFQNTYPIVPKMSNEDKKIYVIEADEPLEYQISFVKNTINKNEKKLKIK